MSFNFQKKDMKKRLTSIILAFALLVSSIYLVGEHTPFAAKRAKLKSIEVSMKETEKVKRVGNTYYMVTGTSSKIYVKPKLTRNVKLKSTRRFKSSKKKIISVTSSGKVRARKRGQAYITVKVTTRKTKNLAKSSKSKRFRVVSLSSSDFRKKFNNVGSNQKTPSSDNNKSGEGTTKKPTTPTKPTTPATPSTTPKEKTMQEILDGMVDSSGTLRLTLDFYNKYPQYKETSYNYAVPTETTKAKKIILPELNFAGLQKYTFNSLRTDIVYSVPSNIVFRYGNYDDTTFLSNNQANIMNLRDFYAFTRKGEFTGDPYTIPYFTGWDGGVTKLKVQNSKNKQWYTFQFEVYKSDNSSTNYKRYTAMKNICKTAFSGCKTDMEKMKKVCSLVQSGKIGNVESYPYSCGLYAELVSKYCNLIGIPCTIRTAKYDWFYGQAFSHSNCLALLDGKVYVVDPRYTDIFLYSEFCDINCKYLDYTNSHGTNLKGQVDRNLQQGAGASMYFEILKKGGYHPQYIN